DKIANPGGTQRGLLLAGPPCQIDMPCARGLKGLRRRNGLPGIDLVGRAQAGKLSAGRLERRRQRCWVVKSLAIDRLDSAGLKKALGEGRPRGEVGRRAEIGEKDLWPRTAL